ncbi:MAG: hypothetical protein AAGF20_02200 [Pseudomonadota bacterium]
MIRGLPASIAFHAAIVGATYVSWPFIAGQNAYISETVTVPVELVDAGALTDIAPIRDPEPTPDPEEDAEPEPVPPQDEPEAEVTEPPPDPVDEDLPEDEIETARSASDDAPVPEDLVPDLDADPEPVDTDPEDTPEPEKQPEQAATEPQRSALDNFLSDAESTFESERATRKRVETPEPERTIKPLEDKLPVRPVRERRGAGERNANIARLEALLYTQVKTCWMGVDDLPDARNLNVELTMRLDQNGVIMDGPDLQVPARPPLGNTAMRTAIQRAFTAIRKCQPYRLPRADYADWGDEIKVRLGPKYEQD